MKRCKACRHAMRLFALANRVLLFRDGERALAKAIWFRDGPCFHLAEEKEAA